jgi:hypothetical protein
MIARPASDDDIRHVMTRLCAADAAAVFARRFDDNRLALADEMLAARRFEIAQFAFAPKAYAPAEALLGALLVSPGVAAMHWLASENWHAVQYGAALSWQEFWCATFEPMLQAAVHRAQCSILAGHRAQARRLMRVGFVCEGIERAAGRQGEDFARYAWLRATVDAPVARLTCRPSLAIEEAAHGS